MRPKTHITYTQKIKYNDLYRYETKDTHNVHTNKLHTMTFIYMRPKANTTYTINKLNTVTTLNILGYCAPKTPLTY